ncbi:Uncharacterised protein [Vibrio cholerae]|nr:Uncharacterised protein [Vibrio cholerae]
MPLMCSITSTLDIEEAKITESDRGDILSPK